MAYIGYTSINEQRRAHELIDITLRSHQPDISEIRDYIENPLFDEIYDTLTGEFGAMYKIEYSGDKVLLGWNVKFRKAGRALLTLYPKAGYFSVLIVIGRREKEAVELALNQMTEQTRDIYASTKEGMGQRWLIIDLKSHDGLYEDALKLVSIRRYGEK